MPTATAPSVEIEINGPHNEQLQFRPLQRSIRGAFDLTRIGEPMAKVKAAEWPAPIPSQRLGLDADGTGYVVEPLHDEEHAALKEKIEARGLRLPPARETFEDVDLPSWLYWLNRAVEAGLAKVVRGKLPESYEGTPRKNFITAEPEPSGTDKLTTVLERQATSFDRLATAIEKLATKK